MKNTIKSIVDLRLRTRQLIGGKLTSPWCIYRSPRNIVGLFQIRIPVLFRQPLRGRLDVWLQILLLLNVGRIGSWQEPHILGQIFLPIDVSHELPEIT